MKVGVAFFPYGQDLDRGSRRRLRFTDAQRRRLAAKGKALGRRVLDQLGGLG